MNRFLYSILLYLLSPLLVLYLAVRAIKSSDYRGRWGERFGFTPLNRSDLLIHSVSMGETLAAVPLIRAIQQAHPQLTITVTTTSPTGSAEVKKAFGDSVQHSYLPFDLPWCVRRFLKQVSPQCCIIMETELWPNLIHYASRSGVKLLLANARLSEKSANQYQKRITLSQPMLQSLDSIAAQSQQAAERFIALGVDAGRVEVCGSLKFDLSVADEKREQAKALRQQWRPATSPVWIAGSIHPGEFDAILAAHRELLSVSPDALLIMVPRHPEKFEAAASKLSEADFTFARRSLKEDVNEDIQVLLGDTMGELLTFYGAADQAFVGGTIVENGGHNPLEPAALGLPVFVGPHHWDFAEITELLNESGALKVVSSAEELGTALVHNFKDRAAYQLASEAGLRVVDANKGALQKQFSLANRLIAFE
ncbi:lipid IV(A) 3-deoxy-D-manno-octulosonic acid transferase [uncultured Shewanella sp.]|uniref:lipid IV(A) 3-deoxy-D-manno-octulosonic acid transferase n=1 Tax=uncultured Shewanella sp. TaxID=173975 RepID=UPI0026174C9D|nr:lipid IV(A) 3-deoxy-D-manno-octulosonic acid transferase [uncultured Shewanella sp.]